MYQTEDETLLNQLGKTLIDKTTNTTKEEATTAIKQLKKVINFADWKYYVQDNPTFSDFEYDTLFRQLKELEKQYPDLVTRDSPTQRIASGISKKFPTVRHLAPMLSLDNSYNADDIRDWVKRCQKFLPSGTPSFVAEPKYDGAGISLYYENDQLVRGVTRGDGVAGEDITPNIRQIKSIPLSAPFSKIGIKGIEIRGEVVIPHNAFEKYNNARMQEGLAPLANPRNAASGSLRMLDPNEVAKRGLHAILYHVSYYTTNDAPRLAEIFNFHFKILNQLYQFGFSTPVNYMDTFQTVDEVVNYCLNFEEKRDDLPFDIDGMVIKVNNIQQQKQIGQTSHHPRWAMAYKFKARQATSKLLRTDFQVGRTGSITPVAKIEPVAIGGATISSVSLFNEDIVREKDVRIGDTVLVERAGDVIPYIVKPLTDLRKGTETPIEFPKTCPECHETLIKPPGEVAWRCINIACPAQVVEHLIHYASKDAMDIRNLGKANIRRFFELGWLNTLPDIYRLNYLKIEKLPNMGEKSAENLKEAIESSKNQALHRLIFGLGIRYVGQTTAKTLGAVIDSLFDLKNFSEEQLSALEDIGEKVAASIYQFFHLEDNIKMLLDLRDSGVNMEKSQKEDIKEDGKLKGKTFLFTGTLTHLKRSEAAHKAEAEGGEILKSVSKKLDYLVVGDKAGSKLTKAQKLGTVTILTEQEFMDLLTK